MRRMELLKKNLYNYNTLRGLHHYVDIETVPRLNDSSYIDYQDHLTYNQQPHINRKYQGVPLTGPGTGFDEQRLTKTEYNPILYKMEDQRYQIDLEMSQLRYILKLMDKQVSVNHFEFCAAFKNIRFNEEQPIKEQLQDKLDKLQ